MTNDLHRVFFHELGHFVACEINQKNFGVLGQTESMIIVKAPNRKNYTGYTRLTFQKGETFSKYLPARLAMLVYGSLFETCFTGTDFENCFSELSSSKHDFKEWKTTIKSRIGREKIADLHQVNLKHFALLKKSKPLKALFKLKPETYLIQDTKGNNRYNVSVEELRGDKAIFLEKHSACYLQYLQDIAFILAIQHSSY